MASDDAAPDSHGNSHSYPNIHVQVPFPFPPPEHASHADATTTISNDAPTSTSIHTQPPGPPNANQAHTHINNAPNFPANTPTTPLRRSRESSSASTATRLRTASIKATRAVLEAAPPPGMWAATGSIASRVPTVTELRGGAFSEDGWHQEGQRKLRKGRRGKFAQMDGPASEGISATTATSEARGADNTTAPHNVQLGRFARKRVVPAEEQGKKSEYANGYIPPSPVPWKRALAIALHQAIKFALTPSGFLITLYGLNVVAWGAMIFFLLLNAAPAMCLPDTTTDDDGVETFVNGCDNKDSPRQVWIEIDSQILNALFCVTAYGLAPWRFRDLWLWACWRVGRREAALRRLAGVYRGWFRLRGSEMLTPTLGPSAFPRARSSASESDTATATDSPHPKKRDSDYGTDYGTEYGTAIPLPPRKIPSPPPTGIRAPPTRTWLLDTVIWMNALNTCFQMVLCYFMWHYDRKKRPSWATGTFVALGCIVAGVGGIVIYLEGRRVKKVEGVPVPVVKAEDGDADGDGDGDGDVCKVGGDVEKAQVDGEAGAEAGGGVGGFGATRRGTEGRTETRET